MQLACKPGHEVDRDVREYPFAVHVHVHVLQESAGSIAWALGIRACRYARWMLQGVPAIVGHCDVYVMDKTVLDNAILDKALVESPKKCQVLEMLLPAADWCTAKPLKTIRTQTWS